MTAQAQDVLMYNDKKLYMSTEPLEGNLKNRKLPHE